MDAKRKRKTIKRKRMIAAHYCYCDVESWRERESRYKQKTVGLLAHIISKESGTLTFSFPEEKSTDVLGKRFLMYRRFFF